MALNKAAITNFAKEKLSTDRYLAEINEALVKYNISVDTVLDNATLMYNMMEEVGAGEDKSSYVHHYLRSGFYVVLIKNCPSMNYQQNNPKLHTELLSAWEQLQKYCQLLEAKRSERASGLGGSGALGGSTPLGGLTVGQDTQPGNSGLGGGVMSGSPIDLSGGAHAQNNSVVPPVQPQAAPQAAAQPTPKPEPVPTTKLAKNQVTPLPTMRASMEPYEAHELRTPAAKVTFEPKVANTTIQQFLEGAKWADYLDKFLSNEEDVVYYQGPEIMVQREYTSRNFMVGVTGNKEYIELVRVMDVEFNSARTSLRQALELTDCDRAITIVTAAVTKMRSAIVNYHDEAVASDMPPIITSEAVRLASALLEMLNRQVHNAIALVTNRGASLPESANLKGVILDNNLDDLTFFAEDVHKRTIGDNGMTSEPDWFLDLFQLVAASALKVNFAIHEDEVSIDETVVTIRIPGAYPSINRYNVITTQSLGCSHDPITAIYEAVVAGSETANVVLAVPGHEYVLMSSGQIAAPIYY